MKVNSVPDDAHDIKLFSFQITYEYHDSNDFRTTMARGLFGKESIIPIEDQILAEVNFSIKRECRTNQCI